MNASPEAIAETVAELVREVRGWAGVEVRDHRFGGTEFTLGPREVGHVHRWGMLDVPYRRSIRDALVAEGATGTHHLLPGSGWTTFYIRSSTDAAQARWLLRLSYLYHVSTLRNSGAEWAPAVDVRSELDSLHPSGRVRAAFERRLPNPA